MNLKECVRKIEEAVKNFGGEWRRDTKGKPITDLRAHQREIARRQSEIRK